MKTKIESTPSDIETRVQITAEPDSKFVADWTWAFQKQIGYHGAAMGRGNTGDAAIADLIRRTNYELVGREIAFSNVPIKMRENGQ